jgi:molecular chaperone IbpA
MTIDFSPLYRSTVGFDRFANLLDAALRTESTSASGYPPYNIESTDENNYAISLAVAGFAENELDIEVEKGVLSVRGVKNADDKNHRNYLYQGIAARNFERKFNLADFVEVKGAQLSNGLLNIALVKRVPEEMKPKRIAINGGTDKVIEHQKDKSSSKAA